MRSIGYGDLATTYKNVLQNARLKADLARLGQELGSGRHSDLRAATGGDIVGYSGIENTLRTLTSYKTATTEASLFAEAVQRSLGQIHDVSDALATSLIAAAGTQSEETIGVAAQDARQQFGAVVSALNTQFGGRSLFAGTAVNAPAIADAETMLADLMLVAAPETTASGLIAAVDNWFDAPAGGFESNGYQGATDDLAGFAVGQNDTVAVQVRADNQELREQMKGFALAALLDAGALSGVGVERAIVLETAGSRILTANSALVELRAEVGTAESRIEQASVRNSAETSALEAARSRILAVDPYQKATELQAAETQLETLYAITARLSRLSLVDYLR